mmetsp:Transcript_8813/g.27797  ORF Transcript_8813/g.27797 Transcript_8813/m.27797 type:complete len:153 (-) Transcript_8813:76-534(-)
MDHSYTPRRGRPRSRLPQRNVASPTRGAASPDTSSEAPTRKRLSMVGEEEEEEREESAAAASASAAAGIEPGVGSRVGAWTEASASQPASDSAPPSWMALAEISANTPDRRPRRRSLRGSAKRQPGTYTEPKLRTKLRRGMRFTFGNEELEK